MSRRTLDRGRAERVVGNRRGARQHADGSSLQAPLSHGESGVGSLELSLSCCVCCVCSCVTCHWWLVGLVGWLDVGWWLVVWWCVLNCVFSVHCAVCCVLPNSNRNPVSTLYVKSAMIPPLQKRPFFHQINTKLQ